MTGPYFYNSCTRQMETRETVKTILLLCEGEKTEPYYFKKFISRDNAKYRLDPRPAKHQDALGIVNEALKEKGKYFKVWCIFDKDNNTEDKFNEAIRKAGQNEISCAYSNECIELWYLLHFHPIKAALQRHGDGCYEERLTEELRRLNKGDYKKNRDDMYDILLSIQSTAIQNAKRLEGIYNTTDTPSRRNPVTTVYNLVEDLNKLR